MSLLSELLEQVSKSDLDEQMKKICDQIMEEEKPKFENPTEQPDGSNMFLAIQFQDKNNISFLCLEREAKQKYIVTLWSKLKKDKGIIKRKQVWEVTEVKVEKILKFYAEILKYVKGE